jgi:hypothetical protein
MKKLLQDLDGSDGSYGSGVRLQKRIRDVENYSYRCLLESADRRLVYIDRKMELEFEIFRKDQESNYAQEELAKITDYHSKLLGRNKVTNGFEQSIIWQREQQELERKRKELESILKNKTSLESMQRRQVEISKEIEAQESLQEYLLTVLKHELWGLRMKIDFNENQMQNRDKVSIFELGQRLGDYLMKEEQIPGSADNRRGEKQ